MARILSCAAAIVSLIALVTLRPNFVPAPGGRTATAPKSNVMGKFRGQFSAWNEKGTTEVQSKADWWGLRASACATLALLLALLPMDAAEAARSGGRMGGSRSFAARPGPRVGSRGFGGPRVSGGGFGGPRVSIGIGSPLIAPMSPFGVAPLSPFGYGFGVPVPLGSIGPSPGSGPSVNDQMLQNQQVQDERKIDEQKQEIATLKKELEELKLQSK